MATLKLHVEAAKDQLLARAHALRVRLGLVDLAEADVELRLTALDQLTAWQLLELAATEPARARENQIAALEAGQRRSHRLQDLRAVARSRLDDQLLYRWRCSCGTEAEGDYFTGSGAQQGWVRHAGRELGRDAAAQMSNQRQCDRPGCGAWFSVPKYAPNKRYCSGRCRRLDRDDPTPSPTPTPTPTPPPAPTPTPPPAPTPTPTPPPAPTPTPTPPPAPPP